MGKKRKGSYPWGGTDILMSDSNYKVKKVIVKPSQRQSYQSHSQRAEAWIVVSGEGQINLDGEISDIAQAAIVTIPPQMKHRISNTSDTKPLVFVEFQIGDYLEEDDIVRHDDDYGRHQDNWTDVDADFL
ncbi:MAG TPA: mannose-6-phosphate isomerase [Flavobacteriales bacterium]|jgi:mannose-6-phosphate isomerase-like protein (cupin superfamily)|nr:mannose-6-phosphate isomerase [Flavobacteriales bacterium]